MKVPYVNFSPQTQEVKAQLMTAVESVLDSGAYVLGPEVSAFEQEFAAYCGAEYAVGVSNGTDALIFALQALGVGCGDEVITVPNSFIATASAIALLGAKPVLVDAREDGNIDPELIEGVITSKTKAIMPVHLTGRPAAMVEINAIAEKHNLVVIEDAAQAVGASLNGKRAGNLGTLAGFSLHPLKNLHAFGDGGMITTNDEALYERLQVLRNLGLKTRNECEVWAYNGRLDSIQAAMLRINLKNLDRWTEERCRLAYRYNEELAGVAQVPSEGPGEHCVYQTYVLQVERRDELLEHLLGQGVDAKVHYPIPIHLQKAASDLGYSENDFPTTMKMVDRIISLPLYPGLTEEQLAHVIKSIRGFYEG